VLDDLWMIGVRWFMDDWC